MAKRCLDKVLASLRTLYPELSPDFRRTLVEEAVENTALQALRGKVRIQHSYTAYIRECCFNKIKTWRENKKGHEVLFGTLDGKKDCSGEAITTMAFANTLIAPSKRPDRAAIERELLRRVGEQVGGLPDHIRDVVVRAREGLDYPQIASELRTAEATVRVQLSDGIERLSKLIHEDGTVTATHRFPCLRRDLKLARSFTGMAEFLNTLDTYWSSPFAHVHLAGMRVSEVAAFLGGRRAGLEAILLHVYWTLRHLTGKRFPEEYLHWLPRHPIYPRHQASFNWW